MVLAPLPYARELAALRREGATAEALRVFLGVDGWDLARDWRRQPVRAAMPHVVLPPGADPTGFDWRPLASWRRAPKRRRATLAALDAIDARRQGAGLPPLPADRRDGWEGQGPTVLLIDHPPGVRGALDAELGDQVAVLCLAAGCGRVRGWLVGAVAPVVWLAQRVE